MARKFLYIIAGLTVFVIAILFALRIWSDELTDLAFVPSGEFANLTPLPKDAYQSPGMWISRPGKGKSDPARWLPQGIAASETSLGASVFFVHPTSYFEAGHWNASLEDKLSRDQAQRWVRNMASPFNESADVWSPRYRQATFGAFITPKKEAGMALDAAYGDIEQAFDVFLAAISDERPIVLAGHSQGAFHLRRLIKERIKGTALEDRLAAAYLIGWPVSVSHDLPEMGLQPCTEPGSIACVVSWQSFAEPADTGQIDKAAHSRGWLDGSHGDGRPYVCTNPLTGTSGGKSPASANRGSLISEEEDGPGSLTAGLIPARCSKAGFLYIGTAPDLGPWVLPGNNYHVYDIPMFWSNLREDVKRRVEAWKQSH